jgi:hypothetical protein
MVMRNSREAELTTRRSFAWTAALKAEDHLREDAAAG